MSDMNMTAINVTVIKEKDEYEFYIDEYISEKFANTATELKFARRALFTNDRGNPAFSLPFEDAKKMAHEILEM